MYNNIMKLIHSQSIKIIEFVVSEEKVQPAMLDRETQTIWLHIHQPFFSSRIDLSSSHV